VLKNYPSYVKVYINHGKIEMEVKNKNEGKKTE